MLFPLSLVPFQTLQAWEYLDSDSGRDYAPPPRKGRGSAPLSKIGSAKYSGAALDTAPVLHVFSKIREYFIPDFSTWH